MAPVAPCAPLPPCWPCPPWPPPALSLRTMEDPLRRTPVVAGTRRVMEPPGLPSPPGAPVEPLSPAFLPAAAWPVWLAPGRPDTSMVHSLHGAVAQHNESPVFRSKLSLIINILGLAVRAPRGARRCCKICPYFSPWQQQQRQATGRGVCAAAAQHACMSVWGRRTGGSALLCSSSSMSVCAHFVTQSPCACILHLQHHIPLIWLR